MVALKRRVYEILEPAKKGDFVGQSFDIFILALIALNVVAVIFGTVESVYAKAPSLFRWFELFSVFVFTIEYFLRVWSSTASTEYQHPIKGRLSFMLSPLAIIDLLAVAPFYLPFISIDLRFLRIVRLFRKTPRRWLGEFRVLCRTSSPRCSTLLPFQRDRYLGRRR